jgi:HEAT repeat protein/tetratricopeptide (TPR) repeat protein
MQPAETTAQAASRLAVDPFQPLLRVLHRYRTDVHQLHDPSGPDGLALAVAAAGGPLPPTLVAFFERWNGATLFRGALRVRSASELAPASVDAPSVVIFADGPRPGDQWAFTLDAQGGAAFGRWRGPSEDGRDPGSFTPLHERFDRWLAATIRILDENLRDPDAQLSARLDADPACGYLLWAEARRVLAAGETEQALRLLERATGATPELIPAWELLGQVQHERGDDPAARFSFLHALRAVRLPAPWPSDDAVGPDLIQRLDDMMPEGDVGWERELVRFLTDGATDAADRREARMAEVAALALARIQLGRGDRREAAAGLEDFLTRASGFRHPPPAIELSIELARVLIDLGRHDDAERRLRRLRQVRWPGAARAAILLGGIAVQRQEPWAELMLREALEDLDSVRQVGLSRTLLHDRAEAHLFLAERHRMQDRLDRARASLARARDLLGTEHCPELQARMDLLEGDLARQQGPDGLAQAEAHWRTAREHAAGDAELLQRVLLRRGDLFRGTGDDDAAIADYSRAAEAYAEMGLPIREAWARLRLAQLGVKGAADQARALFKAADLAAGVVASDAISGDPARSILWHLERSAEHARDRANAQRARPPLTRADAERPERRLGAHRTAIAACDARVVHELAQHLTDCARSLDRSSSRLGDPVLARYVAAVDLIAAHRSFDAAEVLLHQLLEVRQGGLAGRALVGAMARSPNAALVHGLLEALEGGFDPAGMAAAAEVLGWRREQAATPVLTKLLGDRVPRTVRKAAIAALGRIGAEATVDRLLELLDEPGLEAVVGTALLLLGDWRGVDAQAQALAHPRGRDGSRSRGELVGRYGGPSYLLLLYRALEAEGATGIGAIQGLGYLGDPRAVERLIDVLAGRDPLRAQVASGALELITGHHENPEESMLRNRWIGWWGRHAQDFEPGTRYRFGRPFSPGVLIERLHHDDGLVRRTSYDELVISTGQRLSFDAEGPYRVQSSHIRAWERWWSGAQGRFPAGHWTFHGERIG